MLHLHVWSAPAEPEEPDIDEEIDFELSGIYGDHLQLGASLADGRHLELRVPFRALPELINELTICSIAQASGLASPFLGGEEEDAKKILRSIRLTLSKWQDVMNTAEERAEREAR